MLAVILCPGPSLARYSPKKCAFCVGVNRASIAFVTDWFSALDYPMIRDNAANLASSPNLLTRQQTLVDIAKKPSRIARFDKVTVIEDVMDFLHAPKVPNLNSAMSALLFAAWRGATRIEVYGADWSGTLDHDGVAAGENRSEVRWQAERETWELVLAPWLSTKGVVVERMQ